MSDTITATMARWAADLKFEDIGEAAVNEARRYLLDSLGCALGGPSHRRFECGGRAEARKSQKLAECRNQLQ